MVISRLNQERDEDLAKGDKEQRLAREAERRRHVKEAEELREELQHWRSEARITCKFCLWRGASLGPVVMTKSW